MRIVRYVVAVLVLASVGISLRPRDADAAYVAPTMEYGAGVFPMGHPEATGRDFDMLVNAGLTWARITVPWRAIEGACNDCYEFADLDRVVNEAQARGIKLIAKIDHQPAWSRAIPAENGPPDNPEDYADIVAQVVGRYGSAAIPVIEVWNEPNLNREWGNAIMGPDTAAQYVGMLRRAYEEAKKKDPNITVISAGLAPTGTADGTAQPDSVYLQWMYDDGLAKWTDGIGLIGNGFGIPPETPILGDPSRPEAWQYFRHIEQMHDIMVLNGDVSKQVWVMEHGYTTDQANPQYAWMSVPDEATKGNYIVQALSYAKANWSPWIAMITIWTIADPEWTQANEQYWWAITNPDGTPRESYNIIAQAPK